MTSPFLTFPRFLNPLTFRKTYKKPLHKTILSMLRRRRIEKKREEDLHDLSNSVSTISDDSANDNTPLKAGIT